MDRYYKIYRRHIDYIMKKYSEKNIYGYLKNSGNIEYFTYGEFEYFLHQAERELKKMNIARGDRVAVVSHVSPVSVLTSIALTYYGITIVPLDASLPVEEIEKLIVFSDVKLIFTTESFYNSFSSNITAEIPCCRLGEELEILFFDDAMIEKCKSKTTLDPEKDVIAVIYSSGTTGQMKGIMVKYESTVKAAKINMKHSGIRGYMRYLFILPFNHIAGFTSCVTSFLLGCEIDFIQDPDSSKLQTGFQTFQPHFFVIVPKVYEVMIEKIKGAIKSKGDIVYNAVESLMKLSAFSRKYLGINIGKNLFLFITKDVFGKSMKFLGTGASPCKPEIAEFFLSLGLGFENFYASTETNVPIAMTSCYDRFAVDSEGKATRCPEIQVKINKPDKNGTGEITVKSELIMKGYFRRPDLTEQAFENGWFKTGDYGYIDEQNFLHVTGRIKESIILQSGKKVSPNDVDDYYFSRIADYDIASRGIAVDGGQYDEIHLFIADEHYKISEKKAIISKFMDISRYAPEMYKLSDVHFIPEIKRTSVGKIKRHLLNIKDSINTEHEQSQTNINTSGLTVYETVKECIKKLLSLDNDFIITGKMRLKEDIGMDSINIFEMCVELDEKYGTTLETGLHDEITVSEIVGIIKTGNTKNIPVSDASGYPLKRAQRDYRLLGAFINLSHIIWDFKVYGRKNVKSGERYIFCPNHECHFDGMWVIGSLGDEIKHNICSAAADYLFENKILRRGARIMGGIPVHRSGNTATAMKRAFECITKENYNLLIHPEGTRTRNGSLGKFKNGAARLSIDSGLKIIPVCIDGAFEIFPRYNVLPRLFDMADMKKYPLRIRFGKPISPEGKTEEQLTNEIKAQIMRMKQDFREREK